MIVVRPDRVPAKFRVSGRTMSDELQELASLFKEGVLSDEELGLAKNKLFETKDSSERGLSRPATPDQVSSTLLVVVSKSASESNPDLCNLPRWLSSAVCLSYSAEQLSPGTVAPRIVWPL